jgi:hypothetical protein
VAVTKATLCVSLLPRESSVYFILSTIERRGRVDNNPASYLQGPRLKSRPADRLS